MPNIASPVPATAPADCPLQKVLGRRRGRPRSDTLAMPREEILQRAFAAFARDGYDGVSLRALAADCAVSDSLISHHFGTKPQLWREAADSVFGPLFDRLIALLDALAEARGHDPVAVLQHNLPEALKLVASNPVALQFLFREGEGGDERGEYLRVKYIRPYLARLDALFVQAQAKGQFRAGSPASRHALVLGLLRSIVIPGVLNAELAPHLATPESISRYIDEATAVLYHGLALAPHEQPGQAAATTPTTGGTP